MSDTDLLIFWDCNEGSGDSLGDASTGGNVATLEGAVQWDMDVPMTSFAAMAPVPMISTTVNTDSCPDGEWMVGFEC